MDWSVCITALSMYHSTALNRGLTLLIFDISNSASAWGLEQAGHELVVAISRAAIAPTKVTAVKRPKWLLLAARASENEGEPSYAAEVSRPSPAAHAHAPPTSLLHVFWCSPHHTAGKLGCVAGASHYASSAQAHSAHPRTLPQVLHVSVASLHTFQQEIPWTGSLSVVAECCVKQFVIFWIALPG